jgi:peroxiredoxin
VARHYGIASTRQPLAQLGIPERAFFLIDMEGIVRQRWLIKGGEDVVFPTEPLLQAVREVVGKP